MYILFIIKLEIDSKQSEDGATILHSSVKADLSMPNYSSKNILTAATVAHLFAQETFKSLLQGPSQTISWVTFPLHSVSNFPVQ